MKKISDLKNLGPKMQGYLKEIGVFTDIDLSEKGIYQVYFELGEIYPHLKNLMALYALWGAMENINCLEIPEEIKQQIQRNYKKFCEKK